MAYSQEIKNKARTAYIKGMTMKAVAADISVPYETVRGWKRNAAGLGDDWDHARAAVRVSSGGAKELTAAIIEDFILTFQSTIESLKTNENINPVQKANTLAQLGDAYQKVVKAMGDSNPKLSRLSVAMDVLQRQGEFIRDKYPALFEHFAAMLEDFGRELAHVYR